jgi:hypothetical protein
VNRTKRLLHNLGAHWTEGALIYPEGSRVAAIHFEDPDGIRIELYSSDCQAAAVEEDRPGSVAGIEEIACAERLSTELTIGCELS